MAFDFFFRIPPLPKDVYEALKAHRAATGLSSHAVVVAALRKYLNLGLGNNRPTLPVSTMSTPTPPPPSPYWPTVSGGQIEVRAPWLLAFLRPGDKVDPDSSGNGMAVVVRQGRMIAVRDPNGAQEPHPAEADHDGAGGSDSVGG